MRISVACSVVVNDDVSGCVARHHVPRWLVAPSMYSREVQKRRVEESSGKSWVSPRVLWIWSSFGPIELWSSEPTRAWAQLTPFFFFLFLVENWLGRYDRGPNLFLMVIWVWVWLEFKWNRPSSAEFQQPNLGCPNGILVVITDCSATIAPPPLKEKKKRGAGLRLTFLIPVSWVLDVYWASLRAKIG